MAVVLRLPERPAAGSPSLTAGRPASGMTGEIVILPCVRRERIGQDDGLLLIQADLPTQRHA